jgi:uncharacterized protein (DUF2252 family)
MGPKAGTPTEDDGSPAVEEAEEAVARATPARRTPAERSLKGKAARASVPRGSQETWEPAADRRDSVDVLIEQAAGREVDLLPIRYGRMLVSPFTYYRGAAAVMAADLSGTPRSGLMVQTCGDAHVSNFGVFGSPERELVFDINDFDETLSGPWEWDIKRLVTSLAVAGRVNGFPSKQRRKIALTAAAAYRTSMREFAGLRDLDVWYAHTRIEEGLPRLRALLDKQSMKQAERVVEKARTHDSLQAYDKLTTVVDGERRIISDPPLIVPIEELLTPEVAERFKSMVRTMLGSYRQSLLPDRRRLFEQFRFVHIARKVVGVGSVGTRDWIVLMLGRDDRDPLFLQAKEAGPSVLEPFLSRSLFKQHGQRVVEGQRLMQTASDIFLGWERMVGLDGVTRDFYVRQLRDWKGAWAPETMTPAGMAAYGQMCGWTLARAHARSGDRIAIAAYLGASDVFDQALVGFSEAYADQNEADHAALAKAVEDGRVAAETGV